MSPDGLCVPSRTEEDEEYHDLTKSLGGLSLSGLNSHRHAHAHARAPHAHGAHVSTSTGTGGARTAPSHPSHPHSQSHSHTQSKHKSTGKSKPDPRDPYVVQRKVGATFAYPQVMRRDLHHDLNRYRRGPGPESGGSDGYVRGPGRVEDGYGYEYRDEHGREDKYEYEGGGGGGGGHGCLGGF